MTTSPASASHAVTESPDFHASAKPRNPWFYVPTLYFANAFANAAVSNVAVLMFKKLGYSNEFISTIGFLFMPFTIAFLWVPWLDNHFTKRGLSLFFGFAQAIVFGLLALIVYNSSESLTTHGSASWLTLTLMLILGVAGSMFGTGVIGYCLHAMQKQVLAGFSGVGVAFNRLGIVFTNGILLKVCYDITKNSSNPMMVWTCAFGILAIICGALSFYHLFVLDRLPTDKAFHGKSEGIAYRQTFQFIKGIPGMWAILIFFLMYRFGEALLIRMVGPFMMDPLAKGGLGFDVSEIAFMNGIVGMGCSITGGLIGGWAIKTFGLRRLMFPFALLLTIPHLCYVYLACVQPTGTIAIDLSWLARIFHPDAQWSISLNPIVQTCIGIELLGYGIGFSSFTFLAMLVARGPLRTSINAMLSGVGAIGWLVPTILSGWIQAAVGYRWLFILSIIGGIPGVVAILFMPLKKLEDAALRDEQDAKASEAVDASGTTTPPGDAAKGKLSD